VTYLIMFILRFIRSVFLTLLLLAFVCIPLRAEPVPRSINAIVALALDYSAELAALDKEATAQQLRAVQAGTLSNPTLELEGSTGILTGSSESRNASIGINQELPLYGKLRLRRKALEREAEALHRKRDNAARLLKDEVATLALDYLLSDKRYELAVDMVKLNRELVAIAGERFKAGDIPELEFNLTKVELARAESRLLEVERVRSPLRVTLSVLTGLNEADIVLSDKLTTPLSSLKTQDLVKQSLSLRPDLLALALEREKAETEHRLAKAEALANPTVGLFAQWQRNSVEVGGMSAINRDKLLGLRLSVPIPVFDRNTGGTAAARAFVDAARSRHLALERTIAGEVETAISRLSLSERILALLEQGIIPQMTENLKLTQEAYRIGEVGILSVLDQQKKFFEVNETYLSALHARRVAFIKLETAAAINLEGGVQ
jgi:cobalt-zinc-cadmium efflux system outer membrane protein